MESNTIHKHSFNECELREIKQETGLNDPKKALRRWASHQYPINNGIYSISSIKLKQNVGLVEIMEY